jgi:hypothetical protein
VNEHLEQWQKKQFEGQAKWQRERWKLPWPEKLRISVRMRRDLKGFRKEKTPRPSSPPASGTDR